MIIICLAIALASSLRILHLLKIADDERRAFNEIKSQIEVGRPIKADEPTVVKPLTNEEKYAKLKEANADFVGWICIDDTRVDYPVMHTPDYPEYYLHRTFKRKYSFSGTPFIDGRNSLDDDNILIFGHNMRNDTMFSDLLYYKKEKFLQSHRIIRFDTLEKTYNYEVITGLYTEVGSDNHEFHFYDFIGKMNEKMFNRFLKEIEDASSRELDIIPEYGDKFICLVTCTASEGPGRYVVVARLIKNG